MLSVDSVFKASLVGITALEAETADSFFYVPRSQQIIIVCEDS
jgi:hypothetical protein